MLKIDIKRVKEATGMNAKEIAKRIGVSGQLITNLKTNSIPKQLCYMYKLSKLSGISINELIIEDES